MVIFNSWQGQRPSYSFKMELHKVLSYNCIQQVKKCSPLTHYCFNPTTLCGAQTWGDELCKISSHVRYDNTHNTGGLLCSVGKTFMQFA